MPLAFEQEMLHCSALTCRRHWAELLLSGHKSLELRDSSTTVRSQVAIVVSKTACVYGCVEHFGDKSPTPPHGFF